jgi:hypothetical protein
VVRVCHHLRSQLRRTFVQNVISSLCVCVCVCVQLPCRIQSNAPVGGKLSLHEAETEIHQNNKKFFIVDVCAVESGTKKKVGVPQREAGKKIIFYIRNDISEAACARGDQEERMLWVLTGRVSKKKKIASGRTTFSGVALSLKNKTAASLSVSLVECRNHPSQHHHHQSRRRHGVAPVNRCHNVVPVNQCHSVAPVNRNNTTHLRRRRRLPPHSP